MDELNDVAGERIVRWVSVLSPNGRSSRDSGGEGGSTGAAPDVSRELIDAMAYPSEARMLTRHVCRER